MRTIKLELSKMSSLTELHKYLRRALELPVYYGMNLDALYDCLTEISEETTLIVPGAVAKDEYLGWYGKQLLQVLQDAAEENTALKLEIK